MSKGKTKSTSTSSFSQNQSLNPWSQQQWQGQWDKVQGMLGSSPVKAYSGPLVAGLSGREQQARGLFEQNMGSFNPQFDESSDMIRNAGSYADFGGVADKYMNPYEQSVIDTTLADISRMNDEQLSAARGRAAGSGAYGGSRLGVMEANLNDAAQRNAAQTAANLRYQGYNDARDYYGRDMDNQVQRAGLLADLAAGRHGMNMDDIYGLNSLGEVDRGIEQDRAAADYTEWLRQQDEEMRRIGIQTGLLGSIPMLTNTSGTSNSTQTQTTDPGLLGTIGQIGGMASMFVPGGQMAGLFSSAMKTAAPATRVAQHTNQGAR